ncbi:MAG: hypothetical protein AAGB24_02620 [Bacteroidota bacterium]
MEKKNLEQLFKEKFKDFHEVPDDKVWKAIEASLVKKRKRRVIPLWWRLGGVAALLALVLYIVNPFHDLDRENIPAVTEQETDSTPFSPNIPDKIISPIPKQQTEGIVTTSEGANDRPSKGSKNRIPTTESHKAPVPSKNAHQHESLVATLDTQEKEGAETTADEKEVAANGMEDENKNDEKNPVEKFHKAIDKPLTENGAVAQNSVKQEEEREDGEKKSIFEAVEEQQEVTVVENKAAKWSIGASVAPVYFNGIGEGSPIHSNFASNSKSGNVNLSYGITIAYDLGKRLSVRSGIHRVDFGYDTNEVVFSSSIDASTNAEIDNINYNEASRNLVVESRKSASTPSFDDATNAEVFAQSAAFDGRMVQEFAYLEVPIELNYALVDKKFGVNLIGGLSSLFLVDNSVTLQSEGFVTEMGEANNVNSVNFSTNVGVGLDYQFSPKMQLKLEPVFKYQLNTFSDTAGDFTPFSVGIYSGVSFKF